MKRRITPEQLQELTEEQKQKLREWWEPEIHDVVLYQGEVISIVDCYSGKHKVVLSAKDMYDEYEEALKTVILPLLDIGQMIELLEEKFYGYELHKLKYYDSNGDYHEEYAAQFELCDALWEAVKRTL